MTTIQEAIAAVSEEGDQCETCGDWFRARGTDKAGKPKMRCACHPPLPAFWRQELAIMEKIQEKRR